MTDLQFATKEWLSRYKRLNVHIDSLKAEINNWEDLATNISVQYSDMPKSKNSNDKVADAVEKIADLQSSIQDEIIESISIRNEIMQVINSLDDESEKIVLYQRFILGNTLEDTAKNIYMASRTVDRKLANGIRSVSQKLAWNGEVVKCYTVDVV